MSQYDEDYGRDPQPVRGRTIRKPEEEERQPEYYDGERKPVPQPTPRNSPSPDEDPYVSSQPAVFKVIKNPPGQYPKSQTVPYNQDPYQEQYDKMLSMNKQELFDNYTDDEIKKLMDSMGGVDNFVEHFRISNGEFEELFPEMKKKKTPIPSELGKSYPNREVDKTPQVLNQGEIQPQRGKIIEVMAPPPMNKPKNGENYSQKLYDDYPSYPHQVPSNVTYPHQAQPMVSYPRKPIQVRTVRAVEPVRRSYRTTQANVRTKSPIVRRYGDGNLNPPVMRVSTKVTSSGNFGRLR